VSKLLRKPRLNIKNKEKKAMKIEEFERLKNMSIDEVDESELVDIMMLT